MLEQKQSQKLWTAKAPVRNTCGFQMVYYEGKDHNEDEWLRNIGSDQSWSEEDETRRNVTEMNNLASGNRRTLGYMKGGKIVFPSNKRITQLPLVVIDLRNLAKGSLASSTIRNL
ncbi:hypothetical protein KIN20_031325 [Parelaphostrongylus tenuis]|uniref:Uncharacterized protein n=1 Tax=Parelaphostrongylus tenuis TaxID=148309 RepID=A0AAD5R5E6_PARTN|nr:hypothetical protein KIN20_031325 [Parelaphostrongylus tenuis]